MKHVLNLLVLTMISLTLVFCSNSVPQKLDSFVDKAELKSESYSEADWERSNAQYEKLVDEYLNSDKSYTDAEKQIAARAMGRYHALLLSYGLDKSTSFLKNLGNILPSYLEGLASGMEDGAKSFESQLENLFDEEKMEKSLDKLESVLENIFGGE